MSEESVKYESKEDNYIDMKFGCPACGSVDGCDCVAPNPFDRFRIRRFNKNLVIQELQGDPAKENWVSISYHGTNINSLLTGVFNVIVSQHAPVGSNLAIQVEKLRLELIVSVAKVEKMIREAIV
ncbi:MAG: hypothetical protein GY743_23475 [Planctomycetaceae bacterium]|nr:hypothetical protein [Planctomycetaceae bacterium]